MLFQVPKAFKGFTNPLRTKTQNYLHYVLCSLINQSENSFNKGCYYGTIVTNCSNWMLSSSNNNANFARYKCPVAPTPPQRGGSIVPTRGGTRPLTTTLTPYLPRIYLHTRDMADRQTSFAILYYKLIHVTNKKRIILVLWRLDISITSVT